jgi:hypothetical protein
VKQEALGGEARRREALVKPAAAQPAAKPSAVKPAAKPAKHANGLAAARHSCSTWNSLSPPGGPVETPKTSGAGSQVDGTR